MKLGHCKLRCSRLNLLKKNLRKKVKARSTRSRQGKTKARVKSRQGKGNANGGSRQGQGKSRQCNLIGFDTIEINLVFYFGHNSPIYKVRRCKSKHSLLIQLFSFLSTSYSPRNTIAQYHVAISQPFDHPYYSHRRGDQIKKPYK